MKKMKQQISVSGSMPEIDLKSLIHKNSDFFDKIIELIPAKFYLSQDEEKPWFQGLSKDKKAAAKKQSRENIKKARRDRLDPNKSNVTTLDLLKQNLEKEKQKADSDDEDDDDDDDEEEEEDDDDVETKRVVSGIKDEARSATYEDLRDRYQRKLKELRGERSADDMSNRAKKREERSSRRDMFQKKRKRGDESEGKKSATKSEPVRNVEKDAEEATKELRFSHVKIGDEEDNGMMKKRKLSKMKELEKAKELKEAKVADPEKGAKESWRTAVIKAAGVKVHDDPMLLKRSINKQKKQQQKNAEKWKERVRSQNKKKAEKQEKRSHNISERAEQKKMRKIAKREKKLMRPGLEGRQKGYISETTST